MILPLLGTLASGLIGTVTGGGGGGDIFGGIGRAATRLFGSKSAKKKQRQARRAQRAAAGEATTGTLGALGEVGEQGAAGAAGAMAGGGDRATAASNAITTLITGGSDKMVRAMAHQGRASKTDILTLLQALDSVDVSTAEGAQQRSLGVSDKILLSNEIERIFRTRRGRGIPRSLVRLVKQVKYVKKMLGAASSVASVGKGRR